MAGGEGEGGSPTNVLLRNFNKSRNYVKEAAKWPFNKIEET